MADDASSRANASWSSPIVDLSHAVLALLAAGLVVTAAAYPVPTTLPCWTVLSLGPLTLFYIMRLAAVAAARRKNGAIVRRHWLWCALFPAVVIVSAVLITTGVPFRIAFALSRAELEAEAMQILASTAVPGDQWGSVETRRFRRQIGWYQVGGVDIDRQHGHVFFFIGAGIRGMGLVYLRDPNIRSDDSPPDHDLPLNWQRFAYP